MNSTYIASVIVFGSVARGEADQLSDLDVLLVSNDPEFLKDETAKWKSKGWSVATYSPARLKKLCSVKSLFIQHLKQEGLIVSDHNKWLRIILEGFSPKNSYLREARESIALFKPAERMPLRDDGLSFVADNLYVAVRNYGLNLLASQHVYKFEFKDIVLSLRKKLDLKDNDVETLLSLRAGKFDYRERIRNNSSLKSWAEMIDAASRVAKDCNFQSLSAYEPIRWMNCPYATIRDFESWAVNGYGLDCLDQGQISERLKEYWKIVTSPRGYSWSLRCIDEAWVSKVNLYITQTSRDGYQEFVLKDISLT